MSLFLFISGGTFTLKPTADKTSFQHLTPEGVAIKVDQGDICQYSAQVKNSLVKYWGSRMSKK